MQTFRLTLLLVLLGCTGMGCSLDRTWFQMSSNSPMPFFGFDLRMPRRKTSQLENLTPQEQLAQHWNNETEIRPVHHTQATYREDLSRQWLHLPKISTLLESGQVEELSFTGPKAPFSR